MAHLDASGITRLVTDLKTRFAALAHTHAAASDITGQLPIANGGTGSSTASGAVAALGAMTNSARTAWTNSMFATQLTAGCFMYAGAGSTLASAPSEISGLSTDVFLLVDVYAPATDWSVQVVTETATGRMWSRQTRDGGTTWTSWARGGVGDVLPVANGGTGAATAAGARTSLDAAQDGSSGVTLAETATSLATTIARAGTGASDWGANEASLRSQIQTLQDSVDNIAVTRTKLGASNTTGETTLSDSILNYRFIYAAIGYYNSGLPTYACMFIPAAMFVITSDAAYYRDLVKPDGTKATFGFSAENKLKVTVNNTGNYLVVLGVK